jgi:hypothetical protein
LTSFAFLEANNPGLAHDVTATISGTHITATLPLASARTALVATYVTTAADVSVDGVMQVDNMSSHDFTSPVSYVVTAADTTTTTYTVDVTVHSMAPEVDFTTDLRPTAIAIVDVDGDGKPDLALAEYGGHRGIELLVNTTPSGSSTVSFATPVYFPTPDNSAPMDLAVADFNADGKPDIVLGGAGILVALNNSQGTATFGTLTPTGTFAAFVATGDINGDGKPDIVSSRAGAANAIDVTLNTTATGATTATFAPAVTLVTAGSPTTPVVADLDGDGKPDIVVGNNSASSMSIFPNTTPAGATTPTFGQRIDLPNDSGGVGRILVADIDGDGKPDLIATTFGGAVTVLRNKGGLTFAPHVDFPVELCVTGLASGDVNGDGRIDVITSGFNCTFSNEALLLNTTPAGATTPAFAPPLDEGKTPSVQNIAIGDLDGDGLPDIAYPYNSNGSVGPGFVGVLHQE